MKKAFLVAIPLAIMALACNSETKNKKRHLPDSIVADSTKIGPSNQGKSPNTDSPALGTDNIRMDSMNNSSR